MDESITEIRFIAELIGVNGSKPSSREDHHRRNGSRIHEERESKLTTDTPKNRNIQRKHQQRIKNIESELQSFFREVLGVISHPLIRVVNITPRSFVGIENVISPVLEVIGNQAFGQPVAPDQAELRREVVLKCANRQRCHEADAVHPKIAIAQLRVALNQRIREITSNEGDASIDAIDRQQHQDDHAQKKPGQPTALTQTRAKADKTAEA